ncbi:MAG: hypothetical protein ABSG45_06710 [Nitrososphaerales archaeon]|jgi:hypothetical protein
MSNIQAQVQSQNKKGELIGEVRGRSTTTTIKEVTPFGVRMATNGNGHFTGKYVASQVETIDVTLGRDSAVQYDVKGIQNTMEGEVVVFTSRGSGKVTSPTTVALEGEVVFMTQSPKLAWLNTTACWAEGNVDNSTGEYHAKFYAQK